MLMRPVGARVRLRGQAALLYEVEAQVPAYDAVSGTTVPGYRLRLVESPDLHPVAYRTTVPAQRLATEQEDTPC